MARRDLERRAPGGERGSADDHYRRFAKLGVPGFVLDEVEEEEEIPAVFAHLIDWFWDIRRRTLRGFAGEPVQLSEIDAYRGKLGRVGVEMDPLDEELIARLDDVWMEVLAASRS